ncbi:nuclear transport factor 2 family protein [Sphingomonas sp.]|uniref:YybH family protein n=1 Tax=Sphingomonas sp. TaxID=28214 RepID=UPI0025F1B97D|nr:nuclear transport factor 2 family protein [Sphingomonas sp.]MBV9529161.1 nuclear transport factor 2 family protein [Sphingomonas sp.]
MPTNHDPAWLEQLHERFVEALRCNDLKALGSCYTDAAVLLPPGRAVISSPEAIVAYWQGAEHIQDLIFEATDTRAFGEAALREAGNLLITARGQGRDTFNTAAKYVAVWLQVDGTWKIDSMIWNGAGRPAGGGGRRGRAGGGEGAGGGRARPGARQGAGAGGRQAGAGGRRQGGGRGRQGGGDT